MMHPYVNELLRAICSGAQAVLGSEFVGMYVHGSLALGDFDPDRSDIDFVVVTEGELPAETIAALGAMHARIAAGDLKWRTNYEGSYIPLRAFRRHDLACAVHPCVEVDGTFQLARHGPEWVIQRHVIREKGIVLAGPPPATLIDPIAPDDLRSATAQLLQGWWRSLLQDPVRLSDSEYQAYAILTMCRALYTLETGAIATKPQAARWAQGRIGARWGGLIAEALAWRHGVKLDRLSEVREFIRETVEGAAHER